MITGHVFIAVSLDGFIARLDHQLDWLMKQPTGSNDGGFAEFENSVDAIVMGSGSFRNILNIGQWMYQKPVIVMSGSMDDSDIPSDLKDKVRITQLGPTDLMSSLEQEGINRVYVDGGSVVQSFVRDGMVSDLVITTVPILIGSGIRLFGEIDQDIDLELVESKALSNGMVQTRYSVIARE